MNIDKELSALLQASTGESSGTRENNAEDSFGSVGEDSLKEILEELERVGEYGSEDSASLEKSPA